jgi:hypothetical protein
VYGAKSKGLEDRQTDRPNDLSLLSHIIEVTMVVIKS